MKPAAKLIAALAVWLPLLAGQALPQGARPERVAELGKLWAAVKYFHPYLAYKDIPWDAALLEAIPKVTAATSDAEYAQSVQSMLDVLGDPATRVLSSAPSAPPRSELVRRVKGDLLLVTLNPGTEVNGPPDLLGARVAQSKGVVFDLRHQEAWTGSESSTAGLLFVSAGLNSQLAFGVLRAPGHRFRMHSGLASPWDGGSVYYHSAFYVRDGAVVEGAAGLVEKPLVFLVDGSSNLPPIAAALQSAGKAKIVAVGGVSDAALVEKHILALPGGVRVQLRTTELVYEDGTTGLVADAILPDERQALETALRLAGSPDPAQPAARPKLPPYGIPRKEEAYARPEFPDWPHRALAAFRIWAAFEYFFAYRNLMEDDWDQVLVDGLAKLERASDAEAYALAIDEMLVHTKDSHVSLTGSRAFEKFIGAVHPPVETRVIEGLPVVTIAPPESGVNPGDIVLRVDGEEADARLDRLRRYFAAATPWSLDRQVMQVWLNGPPGTAVALTVRGEAGSIREVQLSRTTVSNRRRARSCEIVQILDGNIGYVDLDGLAPARVDAMFEKLRDTKAIIFDMRGYPQGTAWLIAPRLTDLRQVVAARFRQPLAIAAPGLAGDVSTSSAEWNYLQHIPDSARWKYRGKTVMLIDERAMSQSEHMGLFLEAANGTKFIGSRTAGTNGDVTRFAVPGGIRISFSGLDIRHADGRRLQGVGLVPDLEVKPTISGLRAGRDEVLEQALEYLGVHGARITGAGEAR